jgi:hypothetical protein
MLRLGKDKSPRQRTVARNIVDPGLDQHDIFEIDRSNLIFQLRILRRAINESAEEIDMIAIERVFVDSLSRALTRSARRSYLLAEDLDALLRLVERARLPKARVRSNPEPKPLRRRKKRT